MCLEPLSVIDLLNNREGMRSVACDRRREGWMDESIQALMEVELVLAFISSSHECIDRACLGCGGFSLREGGVEVVVVDQLRTSCCVVVITHTIIIHVEGVPLQKSRLQNCVNSKFWTVGETSGRYRPDKRWPGTL